MIQRYKKVFKKNLAHLVFIFSVILFCFETEKQNRHSLIFFHFGFAMKETGMIFFLLFFH